MLWIAVETCAWNMPIWQAGGACNLGKHENVQEFNKSSVCQVIGGQDGDMIP
jgi:hypothetical protein